VNLPVSPLESPLVNLLESPLGSRLENPLESPLGSRLENPLVSPLVSLLESPLVSPLGNPRVNLLINQLINPRVNQLGYLLRHRHSSMVKVETSFSGRIKKDGEKLGCVRIIAMIVDLALCKAIDVLAIWD
jgi:hypothetical protein